MRTKTSMLYTRQKHGQWRTMREEMMNYRKPGVMALKNAASFNTIERMPLDEVRRIQEDLLRRQMGYLKENSTLYQKKLAAAGVDFDDVQTIADLSKVPFTVKQDFPFRRGQ